MQPENRPPEDRASFKARLERMLSESKRRQERLEGAIKKLDEGAPVEQVRQEADGPRPPGGSRDPNAQRPPRNGSGPRGPGEQGPRGEDPRRPGGQPPQGRMPPEEVLAIIESVNPDIAAKFRQGMKDNAAFTSRILDRLEPTAREIKTERDPAMKQLHIDNLKNGFDLLGATRAFADANRADPTSDATKQAATKLREVLGVHFDIRTKLHQQEVVLLERRIKQLRDDLAEQLTGREKFIEGRIEATRNFKGRGECGKGDQGEKGATAEPKR